MTTPLIAEDERVLAAEIGEELGPPLARARDLRDGPRPEPLGRACSPLLSVRRVGWERACSFSSTFPLDWALAWGAPRMQLTLLAKALEHGLAPLAEGDTISVCAVEGADRLMLRVSDTGRGPVPGTDLANIRASWKAVHGAATLSLHRNEPHGVVAEMGFPSVSPA